MAIFTAAQNLQTRFIFIPIFGNKQQIEDASFNAIFGSSPDRVYLCNPSEKRIEHESSLT